MAKKGNKNKNGNKDFESGLKSNTKHGIFAIVFFVLALFFLMAKFDMAGVAGTFINDKFTLLLGIGYILLPILFLMLGSSFVKSETPDIGWARTVSAVLFLLAGLGIIDISYIDNSGGLLGEILSTPFVYLFDDMASIIFLGAILIISILVMFDAKLDLSKFFSKLWGFFIRKKEERDIIEKEEPINEEEEVEEEEEEERNAESV